MAQKVETGLTFADWCERADDKHRIELIGGRLLVSASPFCGHQTVVINVCSALRDWVRPRDLGLVLASPFGVKLDEHNVVEPDVIFMSSATMARMTPGWLVGPPDLACEVLSPSTARFDRGRRRALYERFGLPEYWLADPRARKLDVMNLVDGSFRDVRSYAGDDVVKSRVLSGFTVRAGDLFTEVERWPNLL